jgi:hypothetical protein
MEGYATIVGLQGGSSVSNFRAVIRGLALSLFALMTVWTTEVRVEATRSHAADAVASTESDRPDPFELVVAVDESASLSSADIRSIKAALTQLLGLPEIRNSKDDDEARSTEFKIAIMPFSSGRKSPRLDPMCAMATVDEAEERLLKCINGIRRQNTRGNADTDFASALEGAIEIFDNPSASKFILLMTDGQYDPDGNESESEEEKRNLQAALEQLKSENISLWPLGFGNSNLTALKSYSNSAYQGDPNCAAKPYASQSTAGELGKKIQTIVATTNCITETICLLDPSCEVTVNPLMSEITFELSTKDGKTINQSGVVVLNPGGRTVCNEWSSAASSSRVVCTEEVGGDDGGMWKIETTQQNVTSRITMFGQVNIVISDCAVVDGMNPRPRVEIARLDGQPVDFESVPQNSPWPNVIVARTDSSGESLGDIKVELNQASKPLLQSDVLEVGTSLNVGLDKDVESTNQLLVRVDQTVNCVLRPSTPETTTTVSPTTTSPSTTSPSSATTTVPVGSRGGDDEWPPNWLKILLGIAAGTAIAGFVWSRLPKKFPEGVSIGGQNKFVPTVFQELLDISGRRRVYFDAMLGQNGPELVECESRTGARYMLTRQDEEYVRITSLWEPDTDDTDDENSTATQIEEAEPLVVMNEHSFNVRTADPRGSDGSDEQIMLRLIWPEPDFFDE